MTKHLSLLLFSVLLSVVTVDYAYACLDTDKDCLIAARRVHVVNQLSFWQPELNKPFSQRFGPAPPELLEYLKLDNILSDFPERPTAAAIPPDFQRDLDAAIAELPEAIKHAVESRLAGVYMVHGLGGSGFTDVIHDAADKPVAAYVVLDLDVLALRTANEWATWKENTPFRPSENSKLAATIETPANDNRQNALQYILLHEFGHVLSVGRNVHPPWDVSPDGMSPEEANLAQYPFAALSWHVARLQKKFYSNFEVQFPLRKQVVYYIGPELNADKMENVYKQLEQTNFPTLYAATNPFDDFAESFVSYVHTVLMGKPFGIDITRNGANDTTVIKHYGSCWETPRCAEKRKLLEQAIGSF